MCKFLSLLGVVGFNVLWTSPAAAQRAVYLVRHAHKSGNALTPTGVAQAEKLALLLKDSGVTVIYTTQLERTRQTAAPLKALIESKGGHVDVSALKLPEDLLGASRRSRTARVLRPIRRE